ncbi:MAG: lactonase family protein [Lachnospiraceae bacterium]|nr:lactonase family protein [Lachnospiraceae bacterium]
MSRYYFYVGSWQSPRNPDAIRGITIGTYENGKLIPIKRVHEDVNVSMLTYDGKRKVLYTSNELPLTDKGPGGRANAYKADLETGDLEEISNISSFGKMPSFVAYDPLGDFLVLTNHSMGNVILKTVQDKNGEFHLVNEYDETAAVLYELNEDGQIVRACDIVKHTGHGGRPGQTNPHMHSVRFTPDGKYVFICDKGNDGYYVYRLDRGNKKLVLADRLDSVPGAAPRYSALHPVLPIIYFNNESARLLTAARYGEDGKLEKLGDWSTTWEDVDDESEAGQSDLMISEDGRFLYNIIRADNMISVFETDPESGEPKLIQMTEAAGTGQERDLCFSPDGKYLFMSAVADGNVYRYTIGEDGKLSDKELALEDIAPGAMIFIKAD